MHKRGVNKSSEEYGNYRRNVLWCLSFFPSLTNSLSFLKCTLFFIVFYVRAAALTTCIALPRVVNNARASTPYIRRRAFYPCIRGGLALLSSVDIKENFCNDRHVPISGNMLGIQPTATSSKILKQALA